MLLLWSCLRIQLLKWKNKRSWGEKFYDSFGGWESFWLRYSCRIPDGGLARWKGTVYPSVGYLSDAWTSFWTGRQNIFQWAEPDCMMLMTEFWTRMICNSEKTQGADYVWRNIPYQSHLLMGAGTAQWRNASWRLPWQSHNWPETHPALRTDCWDSRRNVF